MLGIGGPYIYDGYNFSDTRSFNLKILGECLFKCVEQVFLFMMGVILLIDLIILITSIILILAEVSDVSNDFETRS